MLLGCWPGLVWRRQLLLPGCRRRRCWFCCECCWRLLFAGGPLTRFLPTPFLLPHPAVMHWGVKEAGRGSDWLQPPLKLLTPTTTLPMGGKSAETPFLSCSGEQGGGRGGGRGLGKARLVAAGGAVHLVRMLLRLTA